MTAIHDQMTLREARALYFAENRFGDDGGYGAAWVDFKLGPLPMPFPNTPARVKAVRFHDLHHILTGYATDTAGEFEISAWELGAGCRDFWAAWQLNLGGMAAGAFSSPRRTFRAFLRGLASRSLYGDDLDTLLDRRVGEVRAERVAAGEPAGPRSWLLFAGGVAVGTAVGLLLFGLVVPMLPVALLAGALRRPPTAQA